VWKPGVQTPVPPKKEKNIPDKYGKLANYFSNLNGSYRLLCCSLHFCVFKIVCKMNQALYAHMNNKRKIEKKN
jgi:hypothetical protein